MRHILVLCTGNSARSILAEAVLNRDGAGRVRAYSAGSRPTGRVNPGALRLLERLGLPTEGYRSKSWDEFAAPGAPKMDLVVTVCDSAPGQTGHWGVDDPAAAPEDQINRAFRVAYHRLSARINAFLALDFEDMDRAALKTRLDAIARI